MMSEKRSSGAWWRRAAVLAGLAVCVGVGVKKAWAAWQVARQRRRRMQSFLAHKMKEWEADESVVIVDKEAFASKVEEFLAAGPDQQRFVMDFDRTITAYAREDGTRQESSHGVIESSPLVPEEYREQAMALFDFYHPRETDPTIGKEERLRFMVEWWDKAHELLIKYKFNRGIIPEAVRAADLQLRDECRPLLMDCEKHGVPVCVFSAGLGDVLEEVMRQKNALTDNIFVVSNKMKFDDAGHLVGFDDQIIHSQNKNWASVKHQTPEFHDDFAHRHCIWVIGDNVGDSHMSTGIDNEDEQCILRVAFLNHDVERLLPIYKQHFDVIILNDGPFSLVRDVFLRSVRSSLESIE